MLDVFFAFFDFGGDGFFGFVGGFSRRTAFLVGLVRGSSSALGGLCFYCGGVVVFAG